MEKFIPRTDLAEEKREERAKGKEIWQEKEEIRIKKTVVSREEKGLLKGKNATCFPGFEDELLGANVKNVGVVQDANIITAQGAGVAWEFGEKIASELVGCEKSQKILLGLQWKK